MKDYIGPECNVITENAERVLRHPVSDPQWLNYDVPEVAVRAGRVISYDLDGNVVMMDQVTASVAYAQQLVSANGNGAQTVFPLGLTSPTDNPAAFSVSIDGIAQEPLLAYTIDNYTDITFTSAPPFGSRIVIILTSMKGTHVGDSTVVATGSTADRSLSDRFSDEINVLDFGAIPDGSFDCYDAIVAASTYASVMGMHVKFPAGKYRVTQPLSIDCISLVGSGSCVTSLIYEPDAANRTFITFVPSAVVGRTGSISGFTILLSGSFDALYMIKTPKNQSQFDSYDTKYVFNDLVMHGNVRAPAIDGRAFTQSCVEAWIFIGDCLECRLSDLAINGSYDVDGGLDDDTAIQLEADLSADRVLITDLFVKNVKTGLRVGNYARYSLSNFEISYSNIGVIVDGNFVHAGSRIGSGFIDAQLYGVTLSEADSMTINSVLFRKNRDGNRVSIVSSAGIFVNGCHALRICSCSFSVDTVNGAYACENDGIVFGIGTATGCYVSANGFGEGIYDCIKLGVLNGVSILDSIITNTDVVSYIHGVAGAYPSNTTFKGLVTVSMHSLFESYHNEGPALATSVCLEGLY